MKKQIKPTVADLARADAEIAKLPPSLLYLQHLHGLHAAAIFLVDHWYSFAQIAPDALDEVPIQRAIESSLATVKETVECMACVSRFIEPAESLNAIYRERVAVLSGFIEYEPVASLNTIGEVIRRNTPLPQVCGPAPHRRCRSSKPLRPNNNPSVKGTKRA